MKYLAALCLTFMVGCSSLGLAPAQTLDQRIGYAYSGVTAALQTIAQATTAGTLSSAQAEKANSLALNVKGILDTARASETTNATGAANYLAMAISALTGVQNYLTANGVKTP